MLTARYDQNGLLEDLRKNVAVSSGNNQKRVSGKTRPRLDRSHWLHERIKMMLKILNLQLFKTILLCFKEL